MKLDRVETALVLFAGLGITCTAVAAYVAPALTRAARDAFAAKWLCPRSEIPRVILQTAEEFRLHSHYAKTSRRLATHEQGFQLWDTGQGRFWVHPTENNGPHPRLFGELAEQDLNIYGLDDLAGQTVLDCGAHIGLFTRSALKRGAARVVAIELSPDSIECLRRNFAPEIEAGRVIVYPKGVWDRDDQLTLWVRPAFQSANSVAMRTAAKVRGPVVPLTTIDKLVGELNLDRVDFIKMDIEGSELRAITGARNTIARWHPRMAICVYHQPSDPTDIPAATGAMAPYQTRLSYRLANGVIGPDIAFFTPAR